LKIFSNYAHYYDFLNQQKNYGQEIDYISSLINNYAPNTNNILDLGCGTGLHAINLADKGYNISGIDQSQDMIKIANNRLSTLSNSKSNLLKFSIGDIRTYTTNKLFDVALSLFHVISYQVTNSDLNQSFNTVSKHLKQDGIFIFDCWYGPAVVTDKPYQREKIFEDDRLIIKRQSTPHIHPAQNRVDVHFDINVTNKLSGKSENFTEEHNMRYLFNLEIEQFLKMNGLTLVHSEEWLTGNEPNFNSWYVTFICKKT